MQDQWFIDVIFPTMEGCSTEEYASSRFSYRSSAHTSFWSGSWDLTMGKIIDSHESHILSETPTELVLKLK